MKRLFVLIFCFGLLACSGTAVAQVKATVEIASVKQVDKKILFTLSSSKPFIFGSNRYYLHIGDQEFFLNKQTTADGKGLITFFMAEEDFQNLTEGTGVYLTYGHILKKENVEDRESVAKTNPQCWSLGKFSRNFLSK